MLVYLRDGSAQTIARDATLRDQRKSERLDLFDRFPLRPALVALSGEVSSSEFFGQNVIAPSSSSASPSYISGLHHFFFFFCVPQLYL